MQIKFTILFYNNYNNIGELKLQQITITAKTLADCLTLFFFTHETQNKTKKSCNAEPPLQFPALFQKKKKQTKKKQKNNNTRLPYWQDFHSESPTWERKLMRGR